MKILTAGKKDYYDYLINTYGIDSDIVFDRRQSIVINDELKYNSPLLNGVFNTNKIATDREKQEKIYYDNGYKTYKIGSVYYIYLKYGRILKKFKVERYIDNEKLKIEYTELGIVNNDPIKTQPRGKRSVVNLRITTNYDNYQTIDLPILKNTWLTGFIKPEDIYNEIYNYLISLKNKNIEDNRTDIEKIESHGMDKKTSFRH